MAGLAQDFKLAARKLRKHRGMTAAVVFMLAMCIGISTALFSVIRGALLDPWPYREHQRLVVFRGSFPVLGESSMAQWSIPEYLDLRAQKQIFAYLMAGRSRDVNLTGGDRPELLHAVAVTANTFEMLGIPPLLGRVFTAEEDRPGGERVVVMSHDLWQRRYAADPHVVGRSVRLDGESYAVLGVMPHRFRWWDADLWFPLGLDLSSHDRSDRRLAIHARLLPGMDVAAADRELAALSRRLESEHVASTPEYRNFRIHLNLLREEVLRDVKPALYVLLASVALVFFVTCFNIANLLLAQAAGRKAEMAVRTAMGASQGRLVRQLLVESLLLAVIGGGLGVALAHWGVDLLVALIPYGYIPAEAEVALDPWALCFSLGLAALSALLFGLAPAREALRDTGIEALKGGSRATASRRSRRTANALVIAEIAPAVVVLIGASLMLQSFLRLTAIAPGFNPGGVLTLRLALPSDRYREGRAATAFFEEIRRRVAAIPGVKEAALADALMLAGFLQTEPVTFAGASPQELGGIPEADLRVVTPEFFSTMEIPLREGRLFTTGDQPAAQRVALVDEALVRRFFHGQSPIGRQMKIGGPGSSDPWRTIVGVVGDVKGDTLDLPPRQEFYLPLAQRGAPVRNMALVIRSRLPAASLVAEVRKQVSALDPDQPVHRIQSMQKILLDSLGSRRLTVALLSLFSLVALLLAAVGLSGVLSYAVGQRTREIGVRMALGAALGTVRNQFLGWGLRLALIGISIGLVLAVVSSRVLARFVYGVSTSDPATFVVIALFFLAVAALASYIPARRAARVDVAEALRQ
jgi:predicted permease